MMEDFDRTVFEFMQEFGFTATYLQAGTATYNPTTGENTVAVTEIPVEAIQLDLPLTRNGASTATGTLIQDGDKQLFIRPPNKTDENASALVVNPAADRVRIGSTEWRIVTFKETNPSANNQILIELYIRR